MVQKEQDQSGNNEFLNSLRHGRHHNAVLSDECMIECASKLVMLGLELSIHMLLKTVQERPCLSENSHLSDPLKNFNYQFFNKTHSCFHTLTLGSDFKIF